MLSGGDSRGLARNLDEEEAGGVAPVWAADSGASKALAGSQVGFPHLRGSAFCAFFFVHHLPFPWAIPSPYAYEVKSSLFLHFSLNPHSFCTERRTLIGSGTGSFKGIAGFRRRFSGCNEERQSHGPSGRVLSVVGFIVEVGRWEGGSRDACPHAFGFKFVRKRGDAFSVLELNLLYFDWPDFLMCPPRAKEYHQGNDALIG